MLHFLLLLRLKDYIVLGSSVETEKCKVTGSLLPGIVAKVFTDAMYAARWMIHVKLVDCDCFESEWNVVERSICNCGSLLLGQCMSSALSVSSVSCWIVKKRRKRLLLGSMMIGGSRGTKERNQAQKWDMGNKKEANE
jgi:hypothetical protein